MPPYFAANLEKLHDIITVCARIENHIVAVSRLIYGLTPRKIARTKRKSELQRALNLLSHKTPLIESSKSQG
jgi:hypothetical protein